MIKIVLGTLSVTAAAIAISVTFFLNSMLGVFGLVSTSVDTFNNLKDSRRIVDKMKSRNKVRSLHASKRFVERSSRKVTSAAVAASTIGTIAVVPTVILFELHDYCEEKKELLEEENILFGTNKEFDYEACLQQGQEDSIKILESVKVSSSIAMNDAWVNAAKYSDETWETIKRSSGDALDSTAETAGELWDALREWVNN